VSVRCNAHTCDQPRFKLMVLVRLFCISS
jgi:hypothetical protein